MKTVYLLKRALAVLALLVSSVPVFAQFRVIGYMPSWAGSVSQVQYSKLTHINYAFLLPTATGGLQPIENPAKLQSLVSTAHANGVKVLISVGGWNNGDDSAFETIGANATYRNTFVTNLVNFANQYNLDGVDIDWEYPDAGASGNNHAALMQQLSTAMHSRGKLLTAAVVATGGAGVLNSVFTSVDFLNLMAYDANDFEHSTYDYAVQSMNYWRGRGLPANKMVLGVPFYGRPSWESYAQLLARGASPNADVFNGVGYNGIPTIKRKTNLAFDQGSGIMIWELSQDATGANSLLTAINQVVVQRTTSTPPPPTTGGITIQAEAYNSMNGVQLEGTSDTGGGQNVGWIDANDWMAYFNVNFPTSGAYLIEYRVASPSGGRLSSDLNAGAIQLGSVAIPATGGWQNWTTVSQTVNIATAGTYNFGVFAQTGGWNFNWFRITKAASARMSAPATAATTTNNALPLEVEVYPNPQTSSGTFTLQLPNYDGTTPVLVQLSDVSGREVLRQKATGSTMGLNQKGKLKAGIYLLKVSDGRNTVSKKLIVE
jgi:hypothetical protein